MANKKRTPKSGFLRFPEARGKVVEEVEIDPDAQAILILFNDDTALSFDIGCCHTIAPELSRRKAGNWTPIKSWRTVRGS